MATQVTKPSNSEAVINMENKDYFLDFEINKVQQISLGQLMQTRKENDARTKKPLRGIYHHDFINQALDICRELGYQPEVYDMFAAHNRDRNQPGVTYDEELATHYGDHNIKAHTLRRVFANIRLTDFDDEENTTNLAISFHQRGIEVGFGNMVKICHNQCMLNPGQYASTFSNRGKERVELEQMADILRSWLVDARKRVVEERERIERMKAIEVPDNKCFELIGRINAMRVAADTKNKDIRSLEDYPLNQAQITKFTEAMLVAYQDNPIVSLWDVYNAATEMYKPGQTDIPNLLAQNMTMVKVLEDNFDF